MLSELIKFLPEGAVFQEALLVKPNSKSAREGVVRKGRFAHVTPFLDKYEVEKREPIPPYLCIVRFMGNRSPAEVLWALHNRPFRAATIGRLFDLCRAHPKKQFGYRVAFLGSFWYLGSNIGLTAYPCLGETADGTRLLASALDRSRFKVGWRFALQPTSREVAELLKEIVEEKDHSATAWITGGRPRA